MEQKFFDLLKEAIEIEDHDVNMEDQFREYPEIGRASCRERV